MITTFLTLTLFFSEPCVAEIKQREYCCECEKGVIITQKSPFNTLSIYPYYIPEQSRPRNTACKSSFNCYTWPSGFV